MFARCLKRLVHTIPYINIEFVDRNAPELKWSCGVIQDQRHLAQLHLSQRTQQDNGIICRAHNRAHARCQIETKKKQKRLDTHVIFNVRFKNELYTSRTHLA